MKTKPGWLVVILISSVQTVLLLIAVLTLFSWFSNRTEEAVAKQACGDNQIISQQIAFEIESAGIRDKSPGSSDLQKISEILTRYQMPNHGFVCVVDSKKGRSISHFPLHHEISEVEFDSTILSSLSKDSTSKKSLLEAINNQLNSRQAIGLIDVGGIQHFVSGQYLPQLNSVLIVAQQRSQLLGSISTSMTYGKKIVFAVTLLIGLICISLIVSSLNRMSANVDNMSAGLEQQVSQREKELVRTQNAVIFGLAKLAESRDNDTGEHLDRIRSYVTILATDLAQTMPEVDEEFVHNLALASSLHDIGKVGIPDSILLKPGRLTQEEREVMELHALIGGECLEAIQSRLGDNAFMNIAKQVAYYHHERWDGRGYPHHLTGAEIPLVARIVAVADVYDALTSKRPYKQPMSHLESKSIVVSGSGTQFDPEIVAAFLRHEDEFEAISRSQLALSDDDVRSDFHVLCERAQNLDSELPSTNA